MGRIERVDLELGDQVLVGGEPGKSLVVSWTPDRWHVTPPAGWHVVAIAVGDEGDDVVNTWMFAPKSPPQPQLEAV